MSTGNIFWYDCQKKQSSLDWGCGSARFYKNIITVFAEGKMISTLCYSAWPASNYLITNIHDPLKVLLQF